MEGPLFVEGGLNSRDEIQSKTRFYWGGGAQSAHSIVPRSKAEHITIIKGYMFGGVAIPLLL